MQVITKKICGIPRLRAIWEGCRIFCEEIGDGTCSAPPALTLQRKNRKALEEESSKKTQVTAARQDFTWPHMAGPEYSTGNHRKKRCVHIGRRHCRQAPHRRSNGRLYCPSAGHSHLYGSRKMRNVPELDKRRT